MRKVLFLLSLLYAGYAQAQIPQWINQPYIFLKWINVRDSMRCQIYFQGTNDTLATQAYARGHGGGGSGNPLPGYGIKITGGDTVSIDTANYRKMDSLYVVTDSTFIVKINGRVYAYKMRGNVFSFNGRTAAVVPQDNDYAAFYPKLDSTYNDPSFISHISFPKITSLPYTLAGYNITDAVRNAGGVRTWQQDVYANRPAFGNLGAFFYATDSNAIYFDTGAGWTKVTTATSGGGTDSAVLAGNLLIKTVSGTAITLKVDTNGLKSFIGTLTGITQLFSKRGALISGTDTVGIDSSVVIAYTDTLSGGKIVTKTFLTNRGYLTSETDPVATAKTITLTQVANRGVIIAGTAGQTLGSGPAWTITADTAFLATNTYVNRQGFIKANQTITLSGQASGSGTTAITVALATNTVTYAQFQQVAASSLVGNPTGSLGNAQAIGIQAPLIFSSSVLKLDTTVVHSLGFNDGRYLTFDSIRVVGVGTGGVSIGYAQGSDTLNLARLISGSNITLTKNSDSSITIAAASGFSNPMTTSQDLIVGGTAGAAGRLGAGANGTFLGVQSGVVGYYTPPGAVSSVAPANGSLIISPTSGSVLASLNPAFTDSFTVIQKFAAGMNIGGTLTLLSTTSAGSALNTKLQVLVQDTSAGQGIVYRRSFQGMDTTGLGKNQGWIPYYDTTCHCWKTEAAPSGGGGSGNTNSNVGGGYRWAIPGTNNVKTATVGIGLSADSIVTNTLNFKADTSYLVTLASGQNITGNKNLGGTLTLSGTGGASSALNGKLKILMADTTAQNTVYTRSFQGMDTTNLGKNQGWTNYYDTTCKCWKVQAPPGFANPMTSAGDLIVGGSAGAPTRAAGNNTTTPQVLWGTGTGSAATAPVWHTLVKGDIGLGNVENTALSTWAGSSSLTTLGTIGAGVWQGSPVTGQFGGTGINNSGKTITLGGSFATSGAFPLTFTLSGSTNVTLPVSGTLVNSSVTTLSSLAGVGTITSGTWQGGIVGPIFGGTGVNNGISTITLAGPLVTTGAFTTTLTATGTTAVTLPTSGTLYGTQAGSITSAQLLASLTDETGTGTAVFSASPALTGTPTAPTAAPGTNTTQIATMAAIQAATGAAIPSGGLAAGTYTPTLISTSLGGIVTPGVFKYQRVGNVVHYSGPVSISAEPATNTQYTVDISLPISSTYSAATDLNGVCVTTGSGDAPGWATALNNSGTIVSRSRMWSTINAGNGVTIIIEGTYIVQ